MFSSLLLDEPLLAAVESLGFETMTEVQQVAIPEALSGKDLVVNARTGSGKTVAYLLPLLQQVLDNPQSVPQAVVLAPTRELCRQINKQCRLLSANTDITSTVIVGGEDPKYQLKALQKFPDVIIATPGRLLEHVRREVIDLDAINILVLDEADRMLDMGFADKVIDIANQCSDECQTVLYSASFEASKFSHLTEQVLYEPGIIFIDDTRTSSDAIVQQKIPVDDEEHKLKICDYLVQQGAYNKVLIFSNKRETADRIGNWLRARDISVAVVHSGIDQESRNRLMSRFRNDEVDVIVSTDLASRGLDIDNLDLVINFDIPRDGEDYLHRIGRTGRMQNSGTAINLVDPHNWNRMVSIENFLAVRCEERQIDGLRGAYTGPLNRKASGKAYGAKRVRSSRKNVDGSKGVKKKNRLRDRKNIGKRRKPKTSTPS